jgi:hypothetical protein
MALPGQLSTPLNLTLLPEIDQKKYPDIYGDLLRLRLALNSLSGSLDSYTGALSEDPAYWSTAATLPATYARLQNITRLYVLCTETMVQGEIANFYDSAGVLNARKANSTTNAKPAHGYLLTSSVAPADYGEFILMGVNPYLSGLTPGLQYFQDTTAGGITTTAPVAIGNIEQVVGWAISTTALWFIPSPAWVQH